MSQKSVESTEVLFNLNQRKIHSIENLRAQSIQQLSQPADCSEVLFSTSDDEFDTDCELTTELQRKLVINDAQALAQQKTPASVKTHALVSDIEPTAPERDDRGDESLGDGRNKQPELSTAHNVGGVAQGSKTYLLRPLQPLLTEILDAATGGLTPLGQLTETLVKHVESTPQTTPDSKSGSTIYQPFSTKKKEIKEKPDTNCKISPVPYQAKVMSKMHCDEGNNKAYGATPHQYNAIVSDSVIAPKPFSGTSSENGEEWLRYFETYAAYRNLQEEDKIRLFAILMRNAAADWISTLAQDGQHSYDSLKQAFTEHYLPSDQLKWIEAGKIWQKQGADEKVADFIVRLKKITQRVEISDEMLLYAFLHGLKPALRSHCLMNGVQDLPSAIKIAKIGEASLSTDPLTSLLMENMKTNSQLAEKQSADIKELTAKVSQLAAVTTAKSTENADELAVASMVRHTTDNHATRNFSPRSVDPRRRHGNDGRSMPKRFEPAQRPCVVPERNAGWRSNAGSRYQTRTAMAPASGEECMRCGLLHRADSCREISAECRLCSRQGHYARCCRSAVRPAKNE